jgi:3-deoxy-manno-octulosonate cytidylyltransferase (CMP-KDO synthetase)
MKPVILIPARLQSTRLPEKPLADIAGEPMIVHVWRRAVQSGAGPVFVACDDPAIGTAITRAGGNAILTKTTHESGSDRIWEALLKIDPHGQYDVVVNVQGDVPTIEPALISAVLAPLAEPDVDIATLACLITNPQERKDPAVVKPLFIRPPLPGDKVLQATSFTRNPAENAGPLYHHIGIYAYRRETLERFVGLPQSPLEKSEKLEQLRAIEAHMRIDVALVEAAPLGVDTPEHLEKARKLLTPNRH